MKDGKLAALVLFFSLALIWIQSQAVADSEKSSFIIPQGLNHEFRYNNQDLCFSDLSYGQIQDEIRPDEFDICCITGASCCRKSTPLEEKITDLSVS